MPLTDDDFVKTGKLEGYSEITYDLQLDDDEDEEEK